MKELAVIVWFVLLMVLFGGFIPFLIVGVMTLIMIFAFALIPNLDEKIDRFNDKVDKLLGLK
jgi:fatty acid desaturase